MALTDARLAEIRARHTATTPGPWRLDGPYCWPFDMSDDPHMSSVISAGEERTAVLVPALDNPRGEKDLAFAVHAHRDIPDLVAEVERLRAHILDIDAHATPYGDIPDDPGYVGIYLVTAGALHRALGKVGHCAPSCQAEAERDEALAELEAARQDAARWRRIEPLIERSHRHGYHLDPVDLLNVAADDTEEAPGA
ncbi:hypothetical protein [Streptosporangium jomthongense]|uniref:Uncharacterized protein n=1 Tax=Streptosporangium jomthongense TaxID=1193683 RepID=A0ABV8F8I5_9ACTN